MAAIKIIATNKKAHFDYEIIESFEAGIELTGPEVKSIRDGHISLKESFATIKDNQLWLNGAHVSPYKPAAGNNEEPTRPRRLLLKRSQINELIGKIQISGHTVVPVKVYFSHGLIKVEVALAKGKKLHDKRSVIKNREIDIEVRRELKDSNH
jgi:SsrA-binding protein